MLDWRIRKLKRQLQASRFRLVHMYKEFAEPLYDMIFVATKEVWRISTNGKCIYFDPDWLQKLGDPQLDFMLSHQLMHITLGHIARPGYYKGDRYHLAADIVANGNLSILGWKYEKLTQIGKIRYDTFLPTIHGSELTSVEAIRYVPIDPSVMEPRERRQFMIDSEEWWDRKEDRGEAGTIVLSPADEDPDDLEYYGPTYGGHYKFKMEIFPKSEGDSDDTDENENEEKPGTEFNKNIRQSLSMLRQEMKDDRIDHEGGQFVRHFRRSDAMVIDWRSILDSFVQEDINDYSFTPPDRRLQDLDFFLPDYNVYTETVKDVLFMIDTSGSVSDELLAIAYDEISQAITQFNGALRGTAAFFDTRVYNPTPFNSIEDIKNLRPFGGGGTDYHVIFDYVNSRLSEKKPSSIVVITDGEGHFPKETEAGNIPVLWLIIGKIKAPWGKCVNIDRRK